MAVFRGYPGLTPYIHNISIYTLSIYIYIYVKSFIHMIRLKRIFISTQQARHVVMMMMRMMRMRMQWWGWWWWWGWWGWWQWGYNMIQWGCICLPMRNQAFVLTADALCTMSHTLTLSEALSTPTHQAQPGTSFWIVIPGFTVHLDRPQGNWRRISLRVIFLGANMSHKCCRWDHHLHKFSHCRWE